MLHPLVRLPQGLHPSSKGCRVKFSGADRTVTDGPFAETKELVAGFWLWNVKSMDEAVEWVRRCPNPMEGESEIEIRPVFEAEDFGAEFTPELAEGFGYLTVRDGVQLSAMVRFPDAGLYGPPPYPTVIEYSGYSPSDPDEPQPSTLLATLMPARRATRVPPIAAVRERPRPHLPQPSPPRSR